MLSSFVVETIPNIVSIRARFLGRAMPTIEITCGAYNTFQSAPGF